MTTEGGSPVSDALSGVTYGYRKADQAALVNVSPDVQFLPFSVWQFQKELYRRRIYSEIRIENGTMSLEFPGFGAANDFLMWRVGQLFTALTEDQAVVQALIPVRPITVFRQSGEIALNPAIPISTRQLSNYMTALGFNETWRGILAGSWSNELVSRDYLCVSFDTPRVDAEKLANLAKPSFAGSCSISIRAYDVPQGTICVTLEYGGAFPLNLPRAAEYGYANIRKDTAGVRFSTLVKKSMQPGAAGYDSDLWNACVFAQALGCHPVGEVVTSWDEDNSSVRKIGPQLDHLVAMKVLPSSP